ncbi:alkbh6 protein [Lentinula edodes]|uniref:Alkbh6 protein n=1 Tax=Lentinula edodes TaxID=5353 RepID=A0A1Q3EHT3_LENED|nr:alkbh6 protein [Lentinula edodes]
MPVNLQLQAQAVDENREVFYIPNFVTEEEEGYLIHQGHSSTKLERACKSKIWGGQLTGKNVLLSQPLPPFVEVHPNIVNRLQSTGVFRASTHGAPNHIIVNEVEFLFWQGIMPHQDGPAYHPVVATISLGTHTAFHYYKYTTGNQGQNATEPTCEDVARIIDPTPVMSVLLEPRSVVITSGSLYTSRLHGIGNQIVDHFTAGTDDLHPPKFADLDVTVANWRLLGGRDAKDAVINGGLLERGIRYSLTCRDVEKWDPEWVQCH